MLYVNDEELGRIDICELLEYDVVFIKYLLINKSKETNHPKIKEIAGQLAIKLKSPGDLALVWAEVFLISSLLLNESVATNNPKTQEKADFLLSKFEAAAKNIITTAG